MKSSKIKSVEFNNKTHAITIQTSAGALDLPYPKLMLGADFEIKVAAGF